MMDLNKIKKSVLISVLENITCELLDNTSKEFVTAFDDARLERVREVIEFHVKNELKLSKI